MSLGATITAIHSVATLQRGTPCNLSSSTFFSTSCKLRAVLREGARIATHTLTFRSIFQRVSIRRPDKRIQGKAQGSLLLVSDWLDTDERAFAIDTSLQVRNQKLICISAWEGSGGGHFCTLATKTPCICLIVQLSTILVGDDTSVVM